MLLSKVIRAFASAICCLAILINAQLVCAQQYSAQRIGSSQEMSNSATRSMSNRYVPRHLREANSANPIRVAQSQQPILSNNVSNAYRSVTGPTPAHASAPLLSGEYVEGEYLDGGYVDGGYVDGGCGCDGDCDCGVGGNYFHGAGGCGCDFGPVNDCRDCQLSEDCWMNGLGGILYNTEYFVGAHGFTSPGVIRANNAIRNPSSFGFYGGFNVGLPLYRLTCGLVSGQFGARGVSSNFNGNPLSADSRDQVFVTAGLFRRVDYGLQFGIVADIFHEDWFTELDVVQIRGDLSYAFGRGSQFGFRFARGVQDSFGEAILIGGSGTVTGDVTNTYRFYYHHACPCGGYNQFFAGWSDLEHAVVGMEYDLPLNCNWSLQTSFTYLIPEESQNLLLANDDEGWNITVGFVWRPRGTGWYQWYHRPLLPVADNGSMIIQRSN